VEQCGGLAASLEWAQHNGRTTNDLSALYRDKAEETRTIAEAIGNCSARASMLEVAATLERMADEEEKRG
jgi:hypothetical protein